MHADPSIHAEGRLAARASGAMFFAVFGAVWLAAWARSSGAGTAAFAAIVILAVALFAAARLRYRRYAPALALLNETPERRRAARVFRLVNAAQWTLIMLLGLVFANTGLAAWIIPMVLIVIGLHFVPLAYVFNNPPHYVTAAALVGLAVAYPLLARGGPTDPVGFLGAGLILWISAVFALRPAPQAAAS